MILILILCSLSLHIRIDEDGIAANYFFGLVEDRHSYHSVSQIQEKIYVDSSKPQRIIGHSFIFFFENGNHKHSVLFGRSPVTDEAWKGLQYAAQKSGRSIEQIIYDPANP